MTPNPPQGARRAAGLLVLLVASAGVLGPSPASAADARHPMIFGAAAYSKEQVQQNERALEHHVEGVRTYKDWDSPLFTDNERWMRDTGHRLFMSIDAQRRDGSAIRFRSIADARPGSTLYAAMVRQADEIKDFRSPVSITFNHEPENEWSEGSGDGPAFAAAWRNLVSIYRSHGVHNARYVFTTTAYAYKRTDSKAAVRYYPGDRWVDDIASDAYNFNGCLGIGHADKWVPLAETIEAQRQFGRKHPGKGLMLLEFGSIEDRQVPGRKAAWINAARELFKQPKYSQYRAVLYWTGRNQDRRHCPFDYATSPSAEQALSRMAHDPAYSAG